MDIWTLLGFTGAYALTVASPGPGMAAVVARALGGGFRGAFPMVLGILLGDLVYLMVAVFGLAAIASHFSAVFIVIRYLGAAYLLYIAYKFWTSKPDGANMRAKDEPFWKTFLSGFSLTLGNPKAIFFYLALLPSVVPLERMTPLALAELTGIVAVVLLLIGCAYAALAAGAREFFKSPKALGRLNKTAAVAMTAAAGAIAFR